MEVSLAHRTMMRMLEGAMVGHMESDPAYPRMVEMFTPDRKYIADNPDGLYYDAAVSPEHEYVIRGKMKGAVYVSITIDNGMEDGGMSTKTLAVLNDNDFDVAEDGSFESMAQHGSPRGITSRTSHPRRPTRPKAPNG